MAATGEFIYLYFGLLSSTAGFGPDMLDAMVELEQQVSHPKLREDKETLLQICWLTFFNNAIDILQIALQTFLLVLAKSNHNTTINWRENQERKKYLFKETLWYLCVCNFSKWVTDSFVEGNLLKNSEAKNLVFGSQTWTGITQSVYPLVLFYRFHSVHMILGVMGAIYH